MGAAAYVGRVGGLAVTLGVGSAVLLGQGTAWADDTGSAASKSSVSAASSTDSDAKDTSDAAEKPAKTSSGTAADDTDDPEQDADADAEAEPDDAAESENAEADADEDADEDVESGQGAASGEDADPDEDVEAEPEPEPEAEAEDPDGASPVKTPSSTKSGDKAVETASATKTPDESTAAVKTRKSDDPAAPPRKSQTVTVPTTTTTATTTSAKTDSATVSPTVAALLTTEQDQAAAAKKPNLITAVVNVVNSMMDWARQKADAQPGDAPQPPFLWALLAFARRELDTLFAARSTTTAPRSAAVTPTSLALTDGATTAAVVPSYSPWLNPQVSPSTNFVSWVTGSTVYSDKLLANTLGRYQVYGTDVGVIWDNGMVDDPTTPYNEHQVLIAVGDTFGGPNMTGRHIYNTLFRSSDRDLSDGMTIPNGEWYTGNMFGGAPLSGATQARPIINRPSWLPNSVTLIPTAGVSVPTEVTDETPFGTIQYVNFMSVSKWGSSGRWTTNYSATAYSYDNGENFTVAPESVRYNSFLSGNRNFQQSAYVKGDDGYVYVYGTPNGRQGAAYLARVKSDDVLNVSQYEYYKKASSGWFGSTPARWVKGSPSSASAIIGKSGGFFGFTKPGYTVSEMSVQYNSYLKKYIVLYGDQSNNIVMRTSDTPEGTWSDATVLMTQQSGGIYAPMLHPWSPSTEGSGSDLYWNLSLWSDYNIMLMRTDLSKL
ncbi:conserved secreted protein [Mycolicibacterium aurum]|uniref:Conserved secreted protein n=1 Tax=Mycolicibacterium aurum TaxID=1791 RepID=A0A3S5EJX4_MYCAU|nr:DUF4185 domain-containing protein [Mycolicibacterium aurum]VEG57918.1 conserved secreted protein [Mycolicibacterium aurum]